MLSFRRVRGGVSSGGDLFELELVASLMRDIVAILGEDVAVVDLSDDPLDALERELAPSKDLSHDPAIVRLLPDMSEDPEEARELRELTESGVRANKVSNLTTVYRALNTSTGRVFVPENEIPAWLAALSDLRLVLGTRLDIDSSERADEVAKRAGEIADGMVTDEGMTEEEQVDHQLTLVYAMITWWQDSLLDAVRMRGPRG
ncbi:DUF2017 family protein [Flaviflexus massiliensis]|uniref:DUF2017 family protein n=1 Tax=Flaviflexus massiliensis TaxID=1522309 RepID=UPI0006D582DC|nr:DUF2017 family protein [Flaviflexus massiliensis]